MDNEFKTVVITSCLIAVLALKIKSNGICTAYRYRWHAHGHQSHNGVNTSYKCNKITM